jgi:hypothetical protein
VLKPYSSTGPLNHAQWVSAMAALRSLHVFTTAAHLLTLDGDQGPDLPPIASVNAGGEASQVQAKGGGLQATVTFVDPGKTMAHIEGPRIRHYLLRIYYKWFVADIADWVTVPVFVGVCYSSNRDGNLVTVKAAGKMSLANHNPLEPYMVPKGTKVTDAIQRVMSKAGDAPAHMDFHDYPLELKHDFWIGKEGNSIVVGDATWSWGAHELADKLDDALLYERQDGALVLRKQPTDPEWFAFEDDLSGGGNGYVVTLKAGPDFSGFVNRMVARWGDNLARKPVVRTVPKSNPLGGENPGMMRNGEPCFITGYREYPEARQRDAVVKALDRILAVSLREVTQVEVTCFVMPCLEWGDLYPFKTRDYSGTTTINSWTLPLDGGTQMTLGFNDFQVVGPV